MCLLQVYFPCFSRAEPDNVAPIEETCFKRHKRIGATLTNM